MTNVLRITLATALAAVSAFAQIPTAVPRERILPDLVKRADSTYAKLARTPATYGSREIFTAMLAYAEARTNLTRVAELLTCAEGMQNRDPQHKAYGNFRWYARDKEVMDFNAVDFCMQHGALLWRFHRDALDPATRERLHALLRFGLTGLVNHRPRTSYTNIALLNASDLILLGEALGDEAACDEGKARLTLFLKTMWEEGAHEFVSPTYYGVDVESLMLLASLSADAETRETAATLATFFWQDIALNLYVPGARLAGAHSRTYDFVFGYGELDQILTACGWLTPEARFTFSSFTPLYLSWQPPADLWRLCSGRYPRLVEQTWGAEPFRSRTHYVCPDVTLSVAWSSYPGRMDIPLAADFPGGRAERQPRLSFIADGRDDPYGRKRIFDGKTHSKAFHLTPWWAGVQDRADALGVAVYRDTDFQDATGPLTSHLLFRKKLDSLWIGEKAVAFAGKAPSTLDVPPGAAVFLRQGSGVIAIRVPWARGEDGAASPVALVDDGNTFDAARLTVTHAWFGPSNRPPHVCAGAAFWLRTGSGLDDAGFAAFRQAFAAASAEVEATPERLSVRVSGEAQPLSIEARAPFTDKPAVSPQPPRTVLGLDGQDVGRAILERSPLVQAYVKSRRPPANVSVAADRPTVWEAEQAGFTVPYRSDADDKASEGAFLWVPDGVNGGGSGHASFALTVEKAGRYRLEGRVETPTPDDDSLFIAVTVPNGAAPLPDRTWSPGVFKTWTWRAVAEIDLPAGPATLTVRPREPGTKLDALRLTPAAR